MNSANGPILRPAVCDESRGILRCQVFGTFETDRIAIVVYERALWAALQFSGESLDQELGGFLLGSAYVSDRQIVEVRRFHAAQGTRSRASSITFTHETWADVNQFRDRQCPTEQIIGWHHTHPGMGVFLSHNDVFIHRSYFREPWQVSLVVDPRNCELAFFHWRDEAIVDGGFAMVEGR